MTSGGRRQWWAPERRRGARRGASALLAVVVLLAAACGGPDAGDASAGGTGGDEPVELRFTWWGSDLRHELTNAAVDAFEERNPEVTITTEFSGFSGYWDRLNTQIAGGNAPDLIQIGFRQLNEYVSSGTLLALDDYVGEQLALDAWDPDTLASARFDGQLYGIPWGLNTQSLLISTSALEDAGVSPPDTTTWTWEDFGAFAQAVSDSTDRQVYGSADLGGVEPALEVFVRQRGKSLYTEDGGLGFTEQDLVDWWTMWDQLRRSGAVPPADVSAAMGDDLATSGLVTGMTATGYSFTNQYEAYSGAADTPLSINRLPGGEQPGQYLRPSMYLTASATTPHADTAIRFIDFVINGEGAPIVGIERGVPGNPEVRQALAPDLSETETTVVEFIEAAEGALGPAPPSPPPGAQAVEELVARVYEQVSFEQVSIADGVEQFFAEAPGLLG